MKKYTKVCVYVASITLPLQAMELGQGEKRAREEALVLVTNVKRQRLEDTATHTHTHTHTHASTHVNNPHTPARPYRHAVMATEIPHAAIPSGTIPTKAERIPNYFHEAGLKGIILVHDGIIRESCAIYLWNIVTRHMLIVKHGTKNYM